MSYAMRNMVGNVAAKMLELLRRFVITPEQE